MIRRKKQKRNQLKSCKNNEEQEIVENNNTFYKIVQNIAIQKSYKHIFGQDDSLECFNFEVHGFFYGFKNEKQNLLKFYDYLHNKFLSDVSVNIIVDNFCKIKRTYNALKLFETICRWKYSSKYQNEDDLCMNPLNRFTKKSLIQINQNKTIYTFRISDLLKHINSNLLFTNNYIHEPKLSKNPYNNLQFGFHDYYNIYFQAKQSDYVIPPLFNLLFLENFDIKKFTVNNYPFIRDKFIMTEYKSFTSKYKSIQIRKMIQRNKHLITSVIDPRFPNDILNDAFGHILLDYLYFRYTINDQKLQESTSEYQKKLVNFFQFNPRFGRKKLVRSYIGSRNYEVHYESNYPTINQLKILCDNDDKIYDEAPEQNYYDSDSDSDSVLSNESANNEPRVHPPSVNITADGYVFRNSDDIESFMYRFNSSVENFTRREPNEFSRLWEREHPEGLFPLDLSNSIIEDVELLENETLNDYDIYSNHSTDSNKTDED